MKIIIRELINRLKDSLSIENDSEIAPLIGLAQNTLSGVISRNSLKFITFELVHELIIKNKLCSNWIIYGIKEKKLDNIKINYTSEILEEINKLSTKQKEYYYHKIKADALELEIKEENK